MARRLGLGFAPILVLALAGVGVTTAGVESQSSPAASRIIDRTLLCSTLVQAGVRKITVYATAAVPGQKEFGGERQQLPKVSLHSHSFSPDGGWAAGITAGGRTGPTSGSDTFLINHEHCSPSRARIPLSARGLDGGAASPFGDSYECFPPRRILVRARAIFRSPTSLRRNARYFWTPTPAERGFLAARTLSGKPLVFAEIRESGAARLFVAPGCIPE